MSNLVKALHDKEAEAKSIFTAMTSGDFKDEKTQAMQSSFDNLMVEIDDLKANIEREKKLADATDFLTAPARVNPRGGVILDDGERKQFKSLGDILTDTDQYKNHPKGRKTHVSLSAEHPLPIYKMLEQKATFSGSGTGLTTFDRPAGIEDFPRQRPTVASLLSQATTDSNTIRFVRQVSFTNAATSVAEGAQKPESTHDLEEVDAPVRKVAVTARVTDETFADFPQVRDFINGELIFMVQDREDRLVLSGDGISPNILGLTAAGSGIQTQAIGTDTLANAIYKAITKIRSVGFVEPDGIVVHPDDYQALRIAQEGGTTGQYFGGGYMLGAFGQPFVSMPPIWGLNTVVTTAISAGDPLVGAFVRGATVYYRNGLSIDATNSNEDDFEKNLISLRAEQRLALAIRRPTAFCQVITT